MHGLIWGVVGFEGARSVVHDMRRVSDAVAKLAKIHDTLEFCSENVAFASAALRSPNGVEPTSPPLPLDIENPFVFEGRIFENDGGSIPDPTDLIAALSSDNTSVLGAIDGDFVAAHWSVNQRTLRLCRDIGGARPLFYVHEPGKSVAFCSLSQPLISAGLSSTRKDTRTIVQMETRIHGFEDRTLLRDQRRVRAAHMVKITAKNTEKTRYWSVPKAPRSVSQADPKDLAAELRARLDRAVRKRLPVDGPVASHLSGGLDSSSIVAIAAKELEPQNRNVIGCFIEAQRRDDVDPVDGTVFINALKQRVPNLQISISERTPVDDVLFGRYLAYAPGAESGEDDQIHQTFDAAARAGAGMIMSGFGGDETASFSGNGGIAGALRGGRIGELRQLLHAHADYEGKPPWYVLAREMGTHLAPRWLHRRMRSAAKRPEDYYDLLAGYLTPKGKTHLRRQKKPRDSFEFRNFRLRDGRLEQNAEILAEMAASHGLHVAFPFLDRDVIALTHQMPATAFFQDGMKRWPIRQAMQDLLPDMILTKKDRIPVDNSYLISIVERRDQISQEIDAMANTDAAEIFDLNALKAAVDQLPSYDQVVDETKLAVAEHQQAAPRCATFVIAFVLARFLSQENTDIKP